MVEDIKFAELRRTPYYDAVIEVNRAYLTIAFDDPRRWEATHWVVTCLPLKGARLSAVSMKMMETFVLFPAEGDIDWFLNVSDTNGSVRAAQSRLPQVDVDIPSHPYRDGGDDQLRLAGTGVRSLRAALADEAVRLAVRALTERLTTAKTAYTKFHNHPLADAILTAARVAPPVAPPAALAVAPPVGVPYQPRDLEAGMAPSTPAALVDPDTVGAGLRAHNRLQNQLAAAVTGAGLDPLAPASPPLFDLAWSAAGTFTVIEVKSLTDENAVRQLRLGLGQILDYANLLAATGLQVRRGLYLEQEPRDGRWEQVAAGAGVTLAWPGSEARFGL